MKDILGRDIFVGDKVGFTDAERKSLNVGVIVSINSKGTLAVIEYKDSNWPTTQKVNKTPDYIVKVTN